MFAVRAVARGGGRGGALPPHDPALPPPRRLGEFIKFFIIAGLNTDFRKFSENFSHFLYFFSTNFIKILVKSQLFFKIFKFSLNFYENSSKVTNFPQDSAGP